MGILSKLFGSQETDFYDEGYTDGGTYREERPNLDRKGFAEAQISASEVNQNELGYKDHRMRYGKQALSMDITAIGISMAIVIRALMKKRGPGGKYGKAPNLEGCHEPIRG